jgi:hypothetical protein
MVLSNGKIQIEAKEDIRKRLGFSTDYFDSLALCFYPHTKNNKMNAFKLLSYLR